MNCCNENAAKGGDGRREGGLLCVCECVQKEKKEGGIDLRASPARAAAAAAA